MTRLYTYQERSSRNASSRVVKHTYFTGLNAIRFYLALSVILDHTFGYLFTWYQHPAPYEPVLLFFLTGDDSVNFFFVLSGFLIMYLLLTEKMQHQTVNFKRFYLRRFLRIWPLYFFVIIFTLTVVPLLTQSPLIFDNQAILGFVLLFATNFGATFNPRFPPLEHVWSIAVEEQFYLVAPHFLHYQKWLVPLLLIIILVPTFLWYWAVNIYSIDLVNLLNNLRYQAIAVGCLFAYAYHTQSNFLKAIYHPLMAYGSIFAVFMMTIFVPIPFQVDAGLHTLITSIIFGILILNVATNPRFRFKLTHPIVEYLGNLSYGMYMYHAMVIYVLYHLLYQRVSMETYYLIAYPLVVALTIAIAALSYRYIEKPFLRLKDRYKPGVSHEKPEAPLAAANQLGDRLSS